jgi:hypothetical protein
VPHATEVRDGCHMMPVTQSSLCVYYGGGRIYVDIGKYRGLVGLCGGMRWHAGAAVCVRGDEQSDGGSREGCRLTGLLGSAPK